MSTITLPRSDIAIAGQDPPSRDWYRWARDITERVGGVSGSGTADLAVSAFEDAGVEEAKAAMADIRAEFGQIPGQVIEPRDESQSPDLNGMWAVIQALAARVEALEQGLSA